jgi:hypothetical protein
MMLQQQTPSCSITLESRANGQGEEVMYAKEVVETATERTITWYPISLLSRKLYVAFYSEPCIGQALRRVPCAFAREYHETVPPHRGPWYSLAAEYSEVEPCSEQKQQEGRL